MTPYVCGAVRLIRFRKISANNAYAVPAKSLTAQSATSITIRLRKLSDACVLTQSRVAMRCSATLCRTAFIPLERGDIRIAKPPDHLRWADYFIVMQKIVV